MTSRDISISLYATSTSFLDGMVIFNAPTVVGARGSLYDSGCDITRIYKLLTVVSMLEFTGESPMEEPSN